ncbi:MAG: hypothetical protein R3A51_20625 [Nannocystaceae bacterium]
MAERRRLRRHKAPQLILDATAWRLDPRRHALQRLRRGDTLCEQDVVHLALRREQAIPGGYDFIGWLMDDAGRSTDPAVDLWVVVDPEVRAALFGSDVLRVDGVPALGEARAWVPAPEAIPAVARRLLGLLDRPPPPLLIDRAWYRPLHALRFALDDDACVPPRGRLAWEYATELAHARRAITALGRTLASA